MREFKYQAAAGCRRKAVGRSGWRLAVSRIMPLSFLTAYKKAFPVQKKPAPSGAARSGGPQKPPRSGARRILRLARSKKRYNQNIFAKKIAFCVKKAGQDFGTPPANQKKTSTIGLPAPHLKAEIDVASKGHVDINPRSFSSLKPNNKAEKWAWYSAFIIIFRELSPCIPMILSPLYPMPPCFNH